MGPIHIASLVRGEAKLTDLRDVIKRYKKFNQINLQDQRVCNSTLQCRKQISTLNLPFHSP